MLIHKYKKPKFPIGLLDSKALLISLLINYCQGKANVVADALSCFSQRSQGKNLQK